MPTRTKIFLVDDHPLVREWLANLLRQQAEEEVKEYFHQEAPQELPQDETQEDQQVQKLSQ